MPSAAVCLLFFHAASLPALDTASSLATHTATFEIVHAKPYIAVTINGQGPFRFVIDTGTGGEAFITQELARQLSLPSTGPSRLSDPSGRNRQTAPSVLIQSLKVAGVEFSSIHAIVHPLSQTDGSCQGLLGFPLFRNYLLTLDFPHRQLALSTRQLTPQPGSHLAQQTTLPFRDPDGIPIIRIQIGHQSIEAQLDSGGTGLSLPEPFAAGLNFQSTPTAFSNANSLSTRFQLKAARLAANIQVGTFTFDHPFVEINPAFPLANFGACPMQNFILTFDQTQHLVRFESSQRTIHLAPAPSPGHLTNQAETPTSLNLIPVG